MLPAHTHLKTSFLGSTPLPSLTRAPTQRRSFCGTPSLQAPRLSQAQPLAMRTHTLTRAKLDHDMRDPPIANLSPKDYQLESLAANVSNDENAIESWPGSVTPAELPAPENSQEKKKQGTQSVIFDFDHEVAATLIDDVNEAIQWLATNQPVSAIDQKKADIAQAKIIDVIDHYASHYWLPLLLERFTPSDWQTLAQHAAFDPAVAHFLSLLTTQLCYSANSPDFFRLEYGLEQMRAGGLQIDALHVETPKDSECKIPTATMNPENAPDSPVIGYLLRFCPKDIDQQLHFWIIGLAGTQTATLGSNIKAHLKALLIDNRHWGYSEYYKNVIKPALVHRIEQILHCDGQIDPPSTVHFAGHSMGGALAHFAALDFPPKAIPHTDKNELFRIIHSNNSARAGNHELRRELIALGAHCITSTHVDDIVTTVPPNFFGYDNSTEAKSYSNALHETKDKMGLLGKNWREGFVRHRLAVFLILFAPDPIRDTFLQKGLLLPMQGHHQTLGYRVSHPAQHNSSEGPG